MKKKEIANRRITFARKISTCGR